MAITKDEVAHVTFLQAAITAAGGTPVVQPAIDIGAAFSTAANAAFNATLPVAFSPYGSDVLFYLGAFIFEDVGASACGSLFFWGGGGADYMIDQVGKTFNYVVQCMLFHN